MSQAEHKRLLRAGVAIMVGGSAVALLGSIAVHLVGLPARNAFNVELYSWVPRGWVPNLIAQIVALSGVMVAMAGAALAFLYKREMTWARATMGAFLFTALMIILYGVIPNEYLTLTQATLDWSGLKTWLPISDWLSDVGLHWLVLNNDISISAAAIKDLIGQGYILTVTVAIPLVMWKWQERSKRLAEEGQPPEFSKYGRPLTKVVR